MPLKGEMRIWDESGTQLEGSRENGSTLVYEFTNKVYLPYDRGEDRIQAMRIRDPFLIVKEIDRLTPLLFIALCNNKRLEKVIITLFRINPEGGDEEPYFEFTLEDVAVTSVETYMPLTKSSEFEELGHLEKVSFLARKLTWTHLIRSITAEDEAL